MTWHDLIKLIEVTRVKMNFHYKLADLIPTLAISVIANLPLRVRVVYAKDQNASDGEDGNPNHGLHNPTHEQYPDEWQHGCDSHPPDKAKSANEKTDKLRKC